MTDNRYGTFKYGTSHKYGASTPSTNLSWGVTVDWLENGIPTNEALRMTNLYISRGRKRQIGAFGDGFEKIPTGQAIITLDNYDGRYDAWDTSSPLFPNVGYGKDVRIVVRYMQSSVSYPIFMGTINNIVPVGYGANAKVVLYVSDNLDFLRNGVGRIAIHTNIAPEDAIGLILDNIGYPDRWGRVLDTSGDSIDYWWCSGNRQAMTELGELSNSFLGQFFCDAQGQARFIARATTYDSTLDLYQDELLKDISNPQPYEIRRNITRIKVHPRTLAATGIIWQLLGNVPSVPPGSVNRLELFANYTYNNIPVPAQNIVQPVANTDYTMNTQEDGGGTNVTADFTVTLTDFGDTAKLVITNTGAGLAYITKLQIRGDAIYDPNVADVTYPQNINGIAVPRELVLDLPWQQDVNIAVDISNVLGPFYAALHPTPAVTLEARPDIQFIVDLFDIITVSIPAIGMTGFAFRVGGIEHRNLMDNCQSIQTKLYLEPYISASGFMAWDTRSEWDTETVFGW